MPPTGTDVSSCSGNVVTVAAYCVIWALAPVPILCVMLLFFRC
jgi:hypothetical protein